ASSIPKPSRRKQRPTGRTGRAERTGCASYDRRSSHFFSWRTRRGEVSTFVTLDSLYPVKAKTAEETGQSFRFFPTSTAWLGSNPAECEERVPRSPWLARLKGISDDGSNMTE